MTSAKDMILKIMQNGNLTQKEIALQLKVEPSQVSRWLSGNQMPRVETYLVLQEKYNEVAG